MPLLEAHTLFYNLHINPFAEFMYVEVDGLQFLLRLCYTDLGRFMSNGMKKCGQLGYLPGRKHMVASSWLVITARQREKKFSGNF